MWLRCSLSRLRWGLILCFLCLSYAIYITFTPLSNTARTEFEKYWLIEHLGEQLGKSKFHFLEQITIAKLLNRTLILPNVGNSEIGLRLNMSFDYYYQVNHLKDVIRTLSTKQFEHLLTNINITRTITAVLVFIGERNCPTEKFSWKSVENTIFKSLLEKFTVKKLKPLCFLTSYGWNPPTSPDVIIKQLNPLHRNTDIIIAIKESSLFLMDPKLLPVHILKHSQTLIDMADNISKAMSPYLAIHWRMEGGDEDGQICAKALLQTVANVSSTLYFKNIYFASDHPKACDRLISNSFRESRLDQTIGYLQVIHKLKPLTFKNISDLSALTDSGILSITEKLICEQSDFFLAGYVPCDRNGAYGREMVKYRHVIAKKPWLYWSNPMQSYEPEKFYPP